MSEPDSDSSKAAKRKRLLWRMHYLFGELVKSIDAGDEPPFFMSEKTVSSLDRTARELGYGPPVRCQLVQSPPDDPETWPGPDVHAVWRVIVTDPDGGNDYSELTGIARVVEKAVQLQPLDHLTAKENDLRQLLAEESHRPKTTSQFYPEVMTKIRPRLVRWIRWLENDLGPDADSIGLTDTPSVTGLERVRSALNELFHLNCRLRDSKLTAERSPEVQNWAKVNGPQPFRQSLDAARNECRTSGLQWSDYDPILKEAEGIWDLLFSSLSLWNTPLPPPPLFTSTGYFALLANVERVSGRLQDLAIHVHGAPPTDQQSPNVANPPPTGEPAGQPQVEPKAVNPDKKPAEILPEFLSATRKGRLAKEQTPLRSWTQGELDEEIRRYKAKWSSTYRDLVTAVKLGKPGAMKSAQEIFGRNAVARALGVKARAMVSDSVVWQGIAEDLDLPRRNKGAGVPRKTKIGVDIALEKRAKIAGDQVFDEVTRRETIQLVQESMSNSEAEATIEKLQRGDMTDDQVRELVKALSE